MITIAQKDLKAVSLAMAKNDIRYYLKGVYVEFNRAETRIVATDGHRLHMVRTVDSSAMVTEPVTFIIPADMVKHCLKAKAARNDRNPQIVFSFASGTIEAALPDGSRFSAPALDGTFPDYRRIIQQCVSGKSDIEAAVYNPRYVLDAMDALEIYADHEAGTGLRQLGSRVGVLTWGDFLAMIMPMRADASPMPCPSLAKPLEIPAALPVTA
jgi:DNA polymerase-3 subunit beta